MQKTRKLILGLSTLAIMLISSLVAPAFAATPNEFKNNTITGNSLQGNPMVAKILSEIEYSKKQIAELQKNQKDLEENQKLIAQQRLIAKQLEEQAWQILQIKSVQNSSENAYARFLGSVSSNETKKIFWGEFSFTNQRVGAGHAAMKKALANGGTWEEAIGAFSKYAAIRHYEMVSLNQALNGKYANHTGMITANQSIPFDQYGRVPGDYIRVPSTVLNHGNT